VAAGTARSADQNTITVKTGDKSFFQKIIPPILDKEFRYHHHSLVVVSGGLNDCDPQLRAV
jgi:hypothetical protein